MNVNSSVISAVDTDRHNLLITFKSGKTYSYAGAAEHFAPISVAPSAGQYFNANVRGKFDSAAL